ncbi:MAG: methionyl-tRNA formyltransferase [Jiangellaceae bacterium]|nr:methionyl-tRNA formyltransferase [Jiangellaceae bacterium]
MRVIFAGTPDTAVPSLRAVLRSRHDVVAVLTRPDAPAGRGRRLTPSPVAMTGTESGLEVLKPDRPRDPAFVARLTELAPDCVAVVAYGALIPPAALDVPKHGWVNLHFSVLPAWRGAAPVQHAILAGDDVTGASTFRIEEGLDTGPVYGVVTEPIHPTDTSGDLLGRLAWSGAQLLVATLDGIDDGTLRPQPQSAQGVSWAPKLTVADAQIDWTAPALRVDRLVRACTPLPGAWTTFRGQRLRVGPVRLDADVTTLAPGEVQAGRHEVRVGTGSHAALLGDLQPPGKQPMPAADWARGARLAAAERLGR